MVCVSEYVKQTWEDRTENAQVIHNIMAMDKPKTKPLLLVTASRLDAPDKGYKRMTKLAELMDRQGVPFIWICFSNLGNIRNVPQGMVFLQPTLDITPWIQKADYLVQLSDEEAFCYSLVEALELKTAVITTDLAILEEIGIENSRNGYVVPLDLADDYDTTKFLKVPKFSYDFDNDIIIDQWRKLLGNMKPTHKYKPQELKQVRITNQYRDTVLNRTMMAGEIVSMPMSRAKIVADAGFAQIL